MLKQVLIKSFEDADSYIRYSLIEIVYKYSLWCHATVVGKLYFWQDQGDKKVDCYDNFISKTDVLLI